MAKKKVLSKRLQKVDIDIRRHITHIPAMSSPVAPQPRWTAALVLGLLVLAVVSGLVLARSFGLTGAAVIGSTGNVWVFAGLAAAAIIALVVWANKVEA